MAATEQVAHAYRHLYRTLLRAVQHANPARYIARDALREAFREPGATHDAESVKRTLWFLEAAAKERGLEHRILKNLLKVRQRRFGFRRTWAQAMSEGNKKNPLAEHQKTAYRHYDMTVAMLNKTMGLCLR